MHKRKLETIKLAWCINEHFCVFHSRMMQAIATPVIWRVFCPFVCPSAKAVVQNEMPLAKNTRVAVARSI